MTTIDTTLQPFIDIPIKGLKARSSGRFEIGDTKTTGLSIRITPKGVKDFRPQRARP